MKMWKNGKRGQGVFSPLGPFLKRGRTRKFDEAYDNHYEILKKRALRSVGDGVFSVPSDQPTKKRPRI